MPEFVLHAPDIDATGKDYTFPIAAAWLQAMFKGTDLEMDAEPESVDDGTLRLHASSMGADVLVRGAAQATLVVPCGRCLEAAKIEAHAEICSLFVPAAALAARRADEADDADISREPYHGDSIVLDDVVRDQLILEVPMQPLCAESCRGIELPAHLRAPTDLGASAESGSLGETGASGAMDEDAPGASSIDPRFAPLMKLKAGQGKD